MNENTPRQSNTLILELSDYLISVKGYSNNTVKSYQNDLIQFFRFLVMRRGQINSTGDTPTDFGDIEITTIDIPCLKNVSLPDIYAFLGFSTNTLDNVDSTRKRKTAAIRSLYHYLTFVCHIDMADPTQNLEIPKVKHRYPIYMTLDEALSLLRAVDGRYAERDLAIIILFLNCGMRLSELTHIKLSDIQDETLHIIGKGNKERNIFLNDACIEAIENYLKLRPEEVESDYLFLSNRKQPISNRTVQVMVDKYIQKACLDVNKFSVHKLRHTAATLMHKYGQVDIRTLQKVLGHENISTTEIYTHIEDDEVRDALYKNPLAHFSTYQK
ncbi:tyrosine-type recombinase/integrase [Eubacterium aggregans]|uniref:tyrosine-type recombinase/integrase n=1 Tax=Eubacterium aggregans TaxID=81409 RepID=UPI003F2AC048